MTNHRITVQATIDEAVADERHASTPAAARKSLLAMIDRQTRSSAEAFHVNPCDEVARAWALSQAQSWDGRTPIALTVPTWNHVPAGGVTFHAG